MPTQRYKLTLAYRGSAYHGWQAQLRTATYTGRAPEEGHGIPTIQETLARAVARIVRHPVDVVGSSRTDACVHAKGPLAHFDTDQLQIPPEGLRRAANAALPADITIRALDAVPPAFDAIRSTTSKRYQYAIWTRPERPTFFPDLAWHRWQPLDVAAMRDAARRLVGTHDFASFAKPGHGRENTVRTILSCDVAARGPLLVVGVEGTGFLWNMVRIIVGTLVDVGLGRTAPAEIDAMLAARERSAAGPTAPPQGLYLQWIKTRPAEDESARKLTRPVGEPGAVPATVAPASVAETRAPSRAAPTSAAAPDLVAPAAGVLERSPSINLRAHHGQFTRQMLEIAPSLPDAFSTAAVESLRKDARFQRGFVAFVRNQFAGFLLFNVIGGAADISWLAVRADLQRRGIGRRLIERLVRELRSANVQSVRVSPTPGCPQPCARLAPFLSATGFRQQEGGWILATSPNPRL